MLDTDSNFLDEDIDFTFIEPSPERLFENSSKSDFSKYEIIANKVQNVEIEKFQSLNKNDFLFIDSSHVSKVGSDVNYIIFEILPVLKPGVLIHFHDIFYPFEMPIDWILEKLWFWNENYILHAFLMNNNKYEIIMFNTYLQNTIPEWFNKEMPECMVDNYNTGSIWIRKL